MESEFNNGAAHCRDLIIANIVGMQNELGCNEQDPKYIALQELLVLITDRYGNCCQPFKG
jgi:hypothetical protein